MSLGLLGGTFDPVHLGHLRAAESARDQLGLDSVLLVPARVPPHRAAPVASAWDRFAMLALATAGRMGLVVSEIELEREGTSYTVDTVAELRARSGETPVLIVGADSFAEMGAWKDAGRLQQLCCVAVVERPGAPAVAPAGVGQRIRSVTGGALAISSSEVRARVAAGRSIQDLVPTSVAEYVEKRGLYR